MKTKYFLVFLVLLLSQISNNYTVAQRCLSFDYDRDGNRISRFVQINCIEMKDYAEVEEKQVVTDITIYPNPTDGCFKIIMPEGVGKEHLYCLIYDLNGVLINENSLSEETDVYIGDKPNGAYLLKIINGDETYSRIIVKH